MPDVSVVIATYNRAESLKDTLASLARQEATSGRFEVVVVDNNSKDDTKRAVEETRVRSPWPIQYFFEARQGISYARNTGIRNASGSVIAFTDDDVVAEKNWVESIWKCFEETEAMAVGGRIERLWHCERPEWFSEEIGGSLIHQDLGPERQRWDSERRHLIGANMAFRRRVFESVGYFREDLGRRGDSLVGGEDREMFQRLMRKGLPIYYEPKAVIFHKVEKNRLSQDYMRRWFAHIGETLGHGTDWRWHHALTIAPLWIWKEVAGSTWRYAVTAANPKAEASQRFASEMWLRHHAAMMKERFFHWLPLGLGEKHCAFNNSRQKAERSKQ